MYIDKLSTSQKKQFETYYAMLVEWNKKFNLTSITDKDEVYLKHFEDSLAGLDFIDEGAQFADVLDIGSGGGFPGMVLAIAKPMWNFTLIDGTAKKVNFLNEVKHYLGLANCKALHVRAEDITDKKFEIITARAVTSVDKLAKYAKPLLHPGGTLFAYKASSIDDELKQCQHALEKLGAFCAVSKYQVADMQRSIVAVKFNQEQDSINTRLTRLCLKHVEEEIEKRKTPK